MKKLRNLLTKLGHRAMHGTGAILLSLATFAVARSIIPNWHGEPELPACMREQAERRYS